MLSKAGALAEKRIQVRCRNSTLAEASKVTIAHIICYNQEDIWFGSGDIHERNLYSRIWLDTTTGYIGNVRIDFQTDEEVGQERPRSAAVRSRNTRHCEDAVALPVQVRAERKNDCAKKPPMISE
jgi:hypothetical protein